MWDQTRTGGEFEAIGDADSLNLDGETFYVGRSADGLCTYRRSNAVIADVVTVRKQGALGAATI